MIFGAMPRVIIAIETDFRCFCLKCNLMNGISKEVYKPVSQKVLLEKSKCKDCGTNKRTFRKYAAFSNKTYKNVPYFGKQKAKKYSKLKWTVLAPEIQIEFSELKPSTIKGMEQLAIDRTQRDFLKRFRAARAVKAKIEEAPTRRRGGPFGGTGPPIINLGQPQQYQQQQQQQPLHHNPYPVSPSDHLHRHQQQSRAQHHAQQQMQQQQQQPLQPANQPHQGFHPSMSGWRRGYHSPSCMCDQCIALDRRNHRA